MKRKAVSFVLKNSSNLLRNIEFWTKRGQAEEVEVAEVVVVVEAGAEVEEEAVVVAGEDKKTA